MMIQRKTGNSLNLRDLIDILLKICSGWRCLYTLRGFSIKLIEAEFYQATLTFFVLHEWQRAELGMEVNCKICCRRADSMINGMVCDHYIN